MFIFEKPNIFLKFFIESSETYCFVFSNSLGLAHLEKSISDDSLFSQFLHPHEIFEKLSAKVPLKELGSYSTTLSSLTGGRASFTMKFASYELVPMDIQDKLLKEYEASKKEEE